MGTSLRTGKKGALPGLYATALETPPALFTLYYLGSARVPHHKGELFLFKFLIIRKNVNLTLKN